MTKVIAFTAGESGAGVTTAAANIGASLALAGKSVLLVEFDSRFSLHKYAGMKAGGTTYAASLFYAFAVVEEAGEIIKEARDSEADFVLVDLGSNTEQFELLSFCDEVVVVTALEEAALQRTDFVLGQLESTFGLNPKLLVNRFDVEASVGVDKLIENTLTDRIVGFVLDSDSFSFYQDPVAVYPTEENGLRFRHISRNLKEDTYRKYRTLHYPRSSNKTWKKITRFLHADTAAGERPQAK
ncbi:AAA family ATPase [Alkalicoccus daliensis]|uniref:CobQ/CobB/MinD/ParA nucleotide binding domain-containing protein n=1 Tax=Alkalicoccus daliensis TaxID=745820 RepID=A0A1G9ZK50_9BACI|nr:AAA family ATPase [Alkalicoccus daliensis]SDN21381.1 CobQ/CobB/MinD/ParA nucleotide binding domain-containing protein [Alkalicoccus daliensis]